MPKKKRGHGFSHVKSGTAGGRNAPRGSRNSSGGDSVASAGDENERAPNTPAPNSPAGGRELGTDTSGTSSVFESAVSPGGSSHTLCEDASCSSQQDAEVSFLGTVEDGDAIAAQALRSVSSILPVHWRVIQGRKGFHVIYCSQGSENIAIQREVFASFDGVIRIYVHRKEIVGSLKENILQNVLCEPLNSSSLKVFVSNVLKVVLAVRNYEICAGVDNSELEQLWASDSSGKIDENIFDESRYVKTFRSNECSLLVPVRRWKCDGCHRAFERQRRRKKTLLQEDFNRSARNDYLGDDQKKGQT